MIQIAGGILLAFFVLAFLPELIRISWVLLKLTFWLAVFGILLIIITGGA